MYRTCICIRTIVIICYKNFDIYLRLKYDTLGAVLNILSLYSVKYRSPNILYIENIETQR